MDFARSVENVQLQNSLRKAVHGNVENCKVRVECRAWECRALQSTRRPIRAQHVAVRALKSLV